MPRRLAAVSHGRLLRDVPRRRQDRRPRAQPGPHLARQGRERHAHGRLSPPPVGKLPGQADRRRLPGRRLRTGRRSQAGQGTGEARSDAGRHARHDHRRRPARSPREQLPGRRFARRSGRPGLGGDFDGPLRGGPFSRGPTARSTRADRARRMPAGRRLPAAAAAPPREDARHAAARLGLLAGNRPAEPAQALSYQQPGRLRLRQRSGRRPGPACRGRA